MIAALRCCILYSLKDAVISRISFRRPARTVVTVFILVFFSVSAAAQLNRAVLTSVNLISASPESCRLGLEVRGQVQGIETMSFDDGRFVFDLASVAWGGPLRRVRPDVPGIREYRFSQLSRDPLVTRIVVEVVAGWSCRSDLAPNGLRVVCSGPSVPETGRLKETGPDIAVVRGIGISSPVAGLDAEGVIDRSLGFIPRDIVKDGLPNFGSVRDDWLGAPRSHKGLDIYGDKVIVQAVADGKVVGSGLGKLAGGWVKISHLNGVESVYVHIKRLSVQTGDRVTGGQPIAEVDGAAGNAVQPQLHFELRLDGQSVDPVPFIFERASEGLKRRITLEIERLEGLSLERASRVRQGVNE